MCAALMTDADDSLMRRRQLGVSAVSGDSAGDSRKAAAVDTDSTGDRRKR